MPAPTIEVRLESFLEREQPRLVRALSSYTGDRDLAEELAAEALARVVRDWETVGGMDAPGAYAHRTAINLANSWFRRQAAHRRALTRRGPTDRSHSDPDTATSIAVRDAVAALPRRQRAAVALYYLAGFSTTEVADLLDVASGTVRSDLHHARNGLRELLGEEVQLEQQGEVEPVVRREDVLARAKQLQHRRTVATTFAVLLIAVAAVGGVMTLRDSPPPEIVDQPPPAPTTAPGEGDAPEAGPCEGAGGQAAEDLDGDGDPDTPGPVSCNYPWTQADREWVIEELDDREESGELTPELADALRRRLQDEITRPSAYGLGAVPLIGADDRALRILDLDGDQTVILIDSELAATATVGEIDVRPGSTPTDLLVALESRSPSDTTVQFIRVTGQQAAAIGGAVETGGPLTALRWSPDGQAIAWSTTDGTVRWAQLADDLQVVGQGDFPDLAGRGATVVDWDPATNTFEGSHDGELRVAYGGATGAFRISTTSVSGDGELTARFAAETTATTVHVGDAGTFPVFIGLSVSNGTLDLAWRLAGRRGGFVLPEEVQRQDSDAWASYRLDAHAGSVVLRTPEGSIWWPNPDDPIALSTDTTVWTPLG